MSQGDNLQDAQAFSGLCDATLSRLVESESYIVTTKDEKIYVLSALDTIQLEAKRVHARAISRATQTAIQGVQDLRDTKCQVRNLRDLMHLVRQYQTGLEEITSTQDKPAPAPHLVEDDQAAFETARNTLKSVIKHAGAERDISALSRLANWRPDVQDDMSFDHVMPVLSDEILRAARKFNKSVSVSYSADEISMAPNFYYELTDIVANTAVWLVERAIKTPEQRLALGLGQSAHIALTARNSGHQFSILMSCDGDINESDSAALPQLGNLSQHGGVLTCNASRGVVRVEISGLSPANTDDKTIHAGLVSSSVTAGHIA